MFSFRSNYIDVISVGLHRTHLTSLLNAGLKTTDTIVLMYHGIVDDKDIIANKNWLQVKETNFRKQMEYIKEHFNPIHMDDIEYMSAKSKKPNVVVTFDDGYKNNYLNAYPILKQLEIPATIFVATSMVDTDNLFWYDRLRTLYILSKISLEKVGPVITSYKKLHPWSVDEKVNEFLDVNFPKWDSLLLRNDVMDTYGALTTGMIQEMDSSGLIKFGSHTHRHEIVTMMSPDEFRTSLDKSLETLKNIGVKPSKYFCFPNGWYDNSYIEVLKEFGLKGSVTTKRGRYNLASDLYQISRIGVGRNYSLDRFATMIATSWIN